MGKLQASTLYTDSETEDTSGSVENVKKKKKSSILKCSNGNMKKKKCKFHTKSEPNDSSDYRSRSSSRSRSNHRFVYKLHGILKNDNKEKERDYGSTDEDDEDMPRFLQSKDRCLVGRVPRPAGTKPGRGGGLAFIIRKNCSNIPPQDSSTSEIKRHRMKRLARKKSY